MQIYLIKTKSVCDTSNCNKKAKYALKLRRFLNLGNTNICDKCLSTLHAQTSKFISPKSPRNIYAKNKKEEVKN